MLVEIKPVTRIEGHLYAYIDIGEGGARVQLRAEGFRGFEKILIGRPIEEAPNIVPRICGVCPVAHHLASVKAVEAALGVEIPRASRMVREVMGLGGVAQSHLLQLGFLLYPDIEHGEEVRNIYSTQLFKMFIVLRKCVLRIVDISGGRHVHPFNAVPGGVLKLPLREDIDVMRTEAKNGLKILSELYGELRERIESFIESNTDVVYRRKSMAVLVGSKEIEFYDGMVKIIDDNNAELLFQPSRYMEFIVEEPIEYSYSKNVYITINGAKKIFRVGPLSRLTTLREIQHGVSGEFYKDFKAVLSKWPQHPLLYNLARLIEVAYCLEKIIEVLDELQNTPATPRAKTMVEEGEGIGIVEAPRGLLIHHYRCSGDGLITYANIITPTTMNIAAMEQDIKELVETLIERQLNNVEYIKKRVLYLIRSYDPCISCSTHTIHISPNSSS